jgi:light-regulated signal transduction histidine kinase (bacteriophytochrome)
VLATGLIHSSAGNSGVEHATDASGKPIIVAYAPLQDDDWGLVVKMDPDELYLAANQLILLVVGVISCLVLAGTAGIIWLVRPLSNTLHRELVRRRQAEYALRQHQDHLEELVEGRTNALCTAYKEMESFSYSVSHDLRAPLRTIHGFSQMLEEDYGELLDETATDLLNRIRKSAIHMDELIDSLLQLSRLSRWSLRHRHVDMQDLARSVFEQLRNEYTSQRIEFQVEDVPAVMADEKLLRVMLENLIGNACKYSAQEAHPVIRFGYLEDNGDTVYFVEDNGVGFDMKAVDKLFGVFQRLHTSEQFEGTGIGLATVKRIVDRHAGRIWAEAKKGHGATFYFSLPKSPVAVQDDELASACA